MRNTANTAYKIIREGTKIAGGTAGALAVEAIMPGSLSQPEDSRISLSELRDALETAIEKSMEKGKNGVIVFVDDLDRLNPPLAVQILELLKNIFTLNNCIFVLAIDYDVVVKGLEPKFGKLSDTNEREFRSFFDKIIQVPFSLPVNDYKPMNFVLASLVQIGYLSSTESNIPFVRKTIEKIVAASVGKNPRSIKRLINTLSLLDCISKKTMKEKVETIEVKIINFAIVALQVCYPKIYNILASNPLFSKWDESIASKLGLHFEKESVKKIDGDVILDALCEKDIFLNKHHKDIQDLFDIIYTTMAKPDTEIEKMLRGILDRSSLTNVSSVTEIVEFDRKDLIYKLHDNVWDYLKNKLPENTRHQPKRNTGNGGFYLWYDANNENTYFEVVFRPQQNEKAHKISLCVTVDVCNGRPERLKDRPYEEVITDPAVLNVIKPLNDEVKRLSKLGIIEGRTFDKIYDNIIDEYLYRKDELWDKITGGIEYWVNQNSAENFEDRSIIAAIGDLIAAAFELNVRALSIE